MMTIFDKLQEQFNQKLPFVIYNKPNESNLIGLFQKNDELYLVNNFTEKGFVFAPFEGDKTILIPEENTEILTENFTFIVERTSSFAVSPQNEESKIPHQDLIEKGIKAINKGLFSKVVLSRKEI